MAAACPPTRSPHRLARTWRAALALTLALLAPPAHLLAAPAEAGPAAPWSPQDYETVYQHYLMSYNGLRYEAVIQRFASQADAEANRFGAGAMKGREKVSWAGLMDAPTALRPALLALGPGEQSAPIEASGPRPWVLIRQLKSADQAMLKRDRSFMAQADAWARAGQVPAPAELRQDPVFRRNWALFTLNRDQDAAQTLPRTLAELRSSFPGLSATDFRFASGETPLTRALMVRQFEVAKALLAAGADPNLCSVTSCPLSVYELPQAMAEALVQGGAKADQHDGAQAATRLSPLYMALLRNDDARAAYLLSQGARATGSGSDDFPLRAAAMAHNKAWVDKLLKLGASPLVAYGPDEQQRPHKLLMSAVEDDAEFSSWLLQRCVQWARTQPAMGFEAWIEQDGKRFNLGGKPVNLKARPFDLVVVPSATGLNLGASFDPRWQQEVQQGQMGNTGNQMAAWGGASAITPGEKELFFYSAKPATATARDDIWGGHMALPASRADDVNQVYHRERRLPDGRTAYVKSFERFFEVQERSGGGEQPSPDVKQLAGRTVYLALAAPLVIGHRTPLLNLQTTTIVFK